VILCVNAKVDLATPDMIRHVDHLINSLLPASIAVSEAINESQAAWYQNYILKKLTEWETKGRKPPTMREIRQSFTASKRNQIEISNALHQLEKINLIRRVSLADDNKPRPGRPPGVRYILAHGV
jgi:hypothetical protein